MVLGRPVLHDGALLQEVEWYSLQALAADIPAIVKGLGHEKCYLVGHDWGGVVSWRAPAVAL